MLMKVIRLTKDAEMVKTTSGISMMSVQGVYDVRYGDNKTPVWCKFTMFGERTTKLCHTLTKGSKVSVYVDDVEPTGYVKQDGTMAVNLSGVIQKIEYASSQTNTSDTSAKPVPVQAVKTPATFAPREFKAPGYADLDDIPF